MEETFAFPPWLDLPEPLVELILERLPLVDYIHFAAVCPKWRSIQRGHRLRHAPHPPPMANQLPWLVPLWLTPLRDLKIYSPSDQKYYPLLIPSTLHNSRCLASCRGWLLLLEDNCCPTPISKQPFLFNPITTVQIPLPPLLLIPWCRAVGVMSTTPMDPDCVVLLVFDCCAFLYRPNGNCAADWTIVQLPALEGVYGGSAIYCGGKFYYSYRPEELYVIDPFLHKPASQLVMRDPSKVSTDANIAFLHEFGGDLFSVQTLYTSHVITGFKVFKADLSEREWMRMETLGDHAIFHYGACSVFLLAADVGCKRNSIYTCVDFEHLVFTWGIFDLSTGGWTEEGTLEHRDFGPWFLPALESTNSARASD